MKTLLLTVILSSCSLAAGQTSADKALRLLLHQRQAAAATQPATQPSVPWVPSVGQEMAQLQRQVAVLQEQVDQLERENARLRVQLAGQRASSVDVLAPLLLQKLKDYFASVKLPAPPGDRVTDEVSLVSTYQVRGEGAALVQIRHVWRDVPTDYPALANGFEHLLLVEVAPVPDSDRWHCIHATLQPVTDQQVGQPVAGGGKPIDWTANMRHILGG